MSPYRTPRPETPLPRRKWRSYPAFWLAPFWFAVGAAVESAGWCSGEFPNRHGLAALLIMNGSVLSVVAILGTIELGSWIIDSKPWKRYR